MRAFILKPDKTYYERDILAIEYVRDDKYTEVIKDVYYYVTDENYKVVRINRYVENSTALYPQVLVRNASTTNRGPWLDKGDIEGYAFFIKTKAMLNNIKRGLPLDPDYERECVEISITGIYNSTNEIADEQDIEDVNWFAGYFHDAYFEKIDWINDNKLEITFSGVWGFKWFKLIFERNIDSHFEEYLDERGLYGASIFIENNQICFVAEEEVNTLKEAIDSGYTYICAGKATFDYEIDYDWK